MGDTNEIAKRPREQLSRSSLEGSEPPIFGGLGEPMAVRLVRRFKLSLGMRLTLHQLSTLCDFLLKMHHENESIDLLTVSTHGTRFL
jgi:hypothetical protein